MRSRLTALLLCVAVALTFSTAFAAETPGFTDVPEEHAYKTAIDYCKEQGFVKGTSATTFNPDGKLTRADFATIWVRTMQFSDENHSFTDLTRLTDYYDTPMVILHAKGIINGTSANTVSPHQYVTREQIALITMRMHNLGAASANAYQVYTDHAAITPMAREAVSACINADVFDGLWDGSEFKPAAAATRGEICKLIYNLNAERYNITIADMEGGEVTANMETARAGRIITLTVTPDEGMQLVDGSLKYNSTVIEGRTFAMPAENVTITAEFEQAPVLESISIATEPDDTEYNVGDTLDLTGLSINVVYTNAPAAVLTEGFTTEPADGDTLDTEGTVTVTVTYEESGVEKQATFDVTVTEAPVSEPPVSEEPTEEPSPE